MKSKSLASLQETTMAKIPGFACVMFSLAMMIFLTAGPTQAATMSCSPTLQLTLPPDTPPGNYQIVPRASLCLSIVIKASDVNLDLNDSTISGNGISVGSEDVPSVSNVSISNGTVTGSALGIRLLNATDCNVRGLRVSSNVTNILLVNSNRNTIIDNVISESGGEGIMFDNSHNNNLSRNKVIDNNLSTLSGGAAIRLKDSAWNIIEFNDVLRNKNLGVNLANSPNNRILNNQISNNAQDGINVGIGSDDNTIIGNQVNDNSFVLAGNGGIIIVSSRNLVAYNRLNRNLNIGISVGPVPEAPSGAVQNLIGFNTARNNTLLDLQDSNQNPNCDKNKWDFNTTPTTKVDPTDCIH